MPDPTISAPPCIRFGVFEVDLRAEELRKNGAKIKLEGQPIHILALLLERPGQVVTREELKQKLWPADTFVDFEHSINAAVKRLREALSDSADTPRFVETLPRRGYRFIYPIGGTTAELPAQPAEAHRPSGRWTSRAVLLWGALVAVLAGLGVFTAVRLHSRLPAAPAPPIHSLAVLPLENLTGDANEDYFVDGLHDELVTRVAQIGALKVISRTSVLRYKKAEKPLSEIARELDVDAVIEGSVQRVNGRVRVSAQLIAARTDQHLWAQSYERDDREVQQVPGEIASAVLNALKLKATGEEQVRISASEAVDPQVYKEYFKGNYYNSKWTRENRTKAMEHYREALELDPSYAPAWAGLANCYQSDWKTLGLSEEEGLSKARAAAGKAIELDPKLRDPHQVLANVAFAQWDWPTWERELQIAWDLDPNWAGPSRYLILANRFDDGIAVAKRAVERDPLGFALNLTLGWADLEAGRHDEAIAQLKRTSNLDPKSFLPHVELAWNYASKKMYPEALAECQIVDKLRAGKTDDYVSNWSGYGCGWVYAAAGRRADALKTLQALSSSDGEDLIERAHIYDALGDRGRAMQLLEQAYAQHATGLVRVTAIGRLWSPELHADPRFQDLRRRVGVPELLARARTTFPGIAQGRGPQNGRP